eukprot:COSAG01_NODE_4108_length_5340_cov_53.162183_5_plen_102_part_00
MPVSRARGAPMLTEICLCHACSCHEIDEGNARTGGDEGAEEAAMRLGQTAFLLGSHRLSQGRALLHGHGLEAAMGGGGAAGAAGQPHMAAPRPTDTSAPPN